MIAKVRRHDSTFTPGLRSNVLNQVHSSHLRLLWTRSSGCERPVFSTSCPSVPALSLSDDRIARREGATTNITHIRQTSFCFPPWVHTVTSQLVSGLTNSSKNVNWVPTGVSGSRWKGLDMLWCDYRLVCAFYPTYRNPR